MFVNCEGLIRPVKMIGGVPGLWNRSLDLPPLSSHYQLPVQPLQEHLKLHPEIRIVEKSLFRR